MKILRQTSQFKRDLKRYSKQPNKLKVLANLLTLLREEQPIPEKYKVHQLSGDYKGCMECHIEGDFLLIWIDETNDVIGLLRLGSHAELFGKGAKR